MHVIEWNLRDDDQMDAGSGHIMGTTVMGDDPGHSVVDPECGSHDHENLVILGSSVFPTGATANPTLTIATLVCARRTPSRRSAKGCET